MKRLLLSACSRISTVLYRYYTMGIELNRVEDPYQLPLIAVE